MSLKILCCGFLVRHPVGGHSWHHLQYLVGLQRMKHDVTYFEHYGWPQSCYDVQQSMMTDDPTYGIEYLKRILAPFGLDDRWCYLAADGTAHGLSRDALSQVCRECDIFLNLSNLNWIDDLYECRRRALVDTDPVFTQIGAHGAGGPFSNYHALFTYGHNVHQAGCDMPTANTHWLPTRQPVVLDLWKFTAGNADHPITTVINWAPMPDQEYRGRRFGQKDREFEPYFDLPRRIDHPMEIAVNGPDDVRRRLLDGGWKLADAVEVSRNPQTYQQFLRAASAEFSVAKHGYVVTQCGWFSDRSTGYLASGRPAILQDTGFSRFLPCGEGLLAYHTPDEAIAAVQRVLSDYDAHSRAARAIAEEYFDADRVLGRMLEQVM